MHPCMDVFDDTVAKTTCYPNPFRITMHGIINWSVNVPYRPHAVGVLITCPLTHCSMGKMDTIMQTTFLICFLVKLCFDLTEVCFQLFNWRWVNITSDSGLASNGSQSINWNQYGQVCWRISVSKPRGVNERWSRDAVRRGLFSH